MDLGFLDGHTDNKDGTFTPDAAVIHKYNSIRAYHLKQYPDRIIQFTEDADCPTLLGGLFVKTINGEDINGTYLGNAIGLKGEIGKEEMV